MRRHTPQTPIRAVGRSSTFQNHLASTDAKVLLKPPDGLELWTTRKLVKKRRHAKSGNDTGVIFLAAASHADSGAPDVILSVEVGYNGLDGIETRKSVSEVLGCRSPENGLLARTTSTRHQTIQTDTSRRLSKEGVTKDTRREQIEGHVC